MVESVVGLVIILALTPLPFFSEITSANLAFLNSSFSVRSAMESAAFVGMLAVLFMFALLALFVLIVAVSLILGKFGSEKTASLLDKIAQASEAVADFADSLGAFSEDVLCGIFYGVIWWFLFSQFATKSLFFNAGEVSALGWFLLLSGARGYGLHINLVERLNLIRKQVN
ncbi:MAG: hypothetical protein V1834_04370 [Candidatus Micrarchaeota archaeon]